MALTVILIYLAVASLLVVSISLAAARPMPKPERPFGGRAILQRATPSPRQQDKSATRRLEFRPYIHLHQLTKQNMKQNHSRPLRFALACNAVFSIGSAGLMLFCPSLVGGWLGVNAPFVLQGIAIGLIMFGADLIHQATRRRVTTWRALYASAGDFAWVAATIVLLAVFADGLSAVGNMLVIGVAIVVGGFGVWQLWAVGYAHRASNRGEYRHCIVVSVKAPAAAMWQIIARLGDIQRYMPSLKSSAILGDQIPGIGSVRRCEDRSGKCWSEECVEFNHGDSFTVRFLSEMPNFPFPAKRMVGGWKVTPVAVGTEIMIWWELEPKPKLLAPVLLPILAFQADRDFPRVVERMALDAVGQRGEVPVISRSMIVSQLLPKLC